MEASKEAISVRVSRLNTQVLGRICAPQNGLKPQMDREGLLDALTVLYDECNTDTLKKGDKFIASFVDKFRSTMSELRRLRVNISDFEVKNVIGRGHFGVVHVVREKQTGDVYAMKTIRKSDSLNQQCASYDEERDIMATTRSAWLTSLQYAFQDSGHLYLVMEFHPGGDLYGLLERQGGVLQESAAVFYLSELVEAIKALHTMGFVHRDVKPDNVLLDRCGHLKLADFGSAAKLSVRGTVSDKDVISVGTPDYIAPEVLQSIDKTKSRNVSYGLACDHWSLGVLAYEITIGNTPFSGNGISATYNKIMNHQNHLKFPNECALSESYINLVKGLLSDQNQRLGHQQIVEHSLFKEIDWLNLRETVPPFVPKVSSVDDTSNFLEVESKKLTPSIDNFKSKTQFSGRNLPFVGFTYTNIDPEVQNISCLKRSEEDILENRKKQVESLQKKLAKAEYSSKEFEGLEQKFEECSRKIEGIESVRNKLEKELATSIADSNALRRTLDLERRERKELENKALDLIKSAKLKWEAGEKLRLEKLNEQLDKQNTRITDLCTANNELTSKLERSQQLFEQTQSELDRLRNIQQEHKDSLAKARALSRRSIVGVENRLEKISSEAQNQIHDLQSKLGASIENRNQLEQQIELHRKRERVLEEQVKLSNEQLESYKKQLETASQKCAKLENDSVISKCNQKEMDVLRDELQKCKTEIERLLSENKCARLEEALKHEREEIRSLKTQLKDLRLSMNESVISQDAIVQEKEAKLESDIKKLQDKLSNMVEEKENLKRKLQVATEKDVVNRIKVKGLEELLARLETGVTKLESGSQDSALENQLKRLEEQIKELHETSAIDKQELRTTKTELWRKEKELSNCELDKRIVERELKSSEEKVKMMTDEIQELNNNLTDQNKNYEDVVSEFKHSNSDMNVEIENLSARIKQFESNISEYKEKYENEQKSVSHLKTELNNALEKIEKLGKDVKSEVKARKLLEKQVDEIREDNIRLHYNRDMSRRDEDEAKRELELTRRDLENTQLNINVLKEACTLLENQLEEYEKLLSTHEEKESSLEDKMSRISDDLSVSRSEIEEAKQFFNEEKSLRFVAERQTKRLQEDVDLLKKECASYKQQVIDYKELSTQLNEDMTVTEERCAELEHSLRQIERQLEGVKAECIAVKEESAKRLTHIHQVRESNYKLNQELIDLKDHNAVLMAKIAQTEISLSEQSNFHKHRELKSDATIQQQTKLIDFLQSKVEDGKKKKTLTDKLFGSSKKENIPPSLALNYRDLESMLMKERESNRNLRDEVTKLKATTLPNERFDFESKSSTPPHSPRTKLALEQLVRSPASQTDKFQRKPSIQRMHHNIPHRFESRLCKKSTKCASCSETLQLGRSVSVCKECSIVSHNKCTSKVPRTCGLPGEYAKHFTKSISSSEVAQKSAESPGKVYELQNWVKVPMQGKKGWEKKFARLEDSKLCIYEHEPVGRLAATSVLELCPSDGTGRVCKEVTASECENTAGTDLAFIIKIDIGPATTCYPDKSHLMMFLNGADKDKWVSALDILFSRNYPQVSRHLGTVLTKLINNEETLCAQEIGKDLLLLGCEEGLYSTHKTNPLLHISGPTQIHQIAAIKSANIVLMIVEDKRMLIRAELKQLESLAMRAQFTNPHLETRRVDINNREGFHIFQASDFAKKQIICAATSKQLYIIKYDYETADFSPLRVLDTAEPCSCILFNEHSVIVGANKYFEIDLKSFAADEFLDVSDTSLSHAYKCHKLGSYPVAIMLVNSHPLEYLLCFNEFGCFVDEYGRRNRESDLKWSHLPIAFAFCGNFLFVVQFAAVEIIRISPDTTDDISLQSWVCPESVRLEFQKPKYLGYNKKGIFLRVKDEILHLNAKSVLGELDSEEESLESENESDCGTEFSFTSSQLQSLDRLSTDSELNEKKVHFAGHTDL